MHRVRALFLTLGIGLLLVSVGLLVIRPEPADIKYRDIIGFVQMASFCIGFISILIFSNKWRILNIVGTVLFGLCLLGFYLAGKIGGQTVGSSGWVVGLILISVAFPAALVVFGLPGLMSLVAVMEKPGSKSGFLIGIVFLVVVIAAVSGMVSIGPDMDKLLARTKTGKMYERIAAIHQLGSIKNVRATDALVDFIHDKDPRIQAEAAFALGNAPVHIMAIVPLTKALRHENPEVRQNAARALGVQIGSRKHKMYPASVDELIARLQDENTNVREAAADALGWIGSKKAIEPLIDILGDEKTRFSAHNALIMITNQRLGDDPEEWRAWVKKNKQ
jgi:hypothetical protein